MQGSAESCITSLTMASRHRSLSRCPAGHVECLRRAVQTNTLRAVPVREGEGGTDLHALSSLLLPLGQSLVMTEVTPTLPGCII